MYTMNRLSSIKNSSRNLLTKITGSCTTTILAGYTSVHTFTSGIGTIRLPTTKTVQILIVGGGGGGGFSATNGNDGAGGGGAGGVGIGTLSLIGGVTYDITIGDGGVGGGIQGLYSWPFNGYESSFIGSGITEKAFGGGAGAVQQWGGGASNNGVSGGSGGGASFGWAGDGANCKPGTGTKGVGTITYYGNKGGGFPDYGTGSGAGGGGGAGTAGSCVPINWAQGGYGGVGQTWTINNSTYGGGGGSGSVGSQKYVFSTPENTPVGGQGGWGGGATGGSPSLAPSPAGINTGGGGGGGSGQNGSGSSGGSGVVIIAYN